MLIIQPLKGYRNKKRLTCRSEVFLTENETLLKRLLLTFKTARAKEGEVKLMDSVEKFSFKPIASTIFIILLR